ncbi:MAG: ABC transporter substrate-binding protein [Hyphomicrobiaceae bacterium]
MKSHPLSRRSVLKGTAATAALAGATSSSDLFGFAKAWAASNPFKPEAGASLSLTRWKRFVQSEDDDAFRAIVASFTKATGVNVKVVEEGLDDIQPKAAVAANTGQGSDMFWGIYSFPHLFPKKSLDLTDAMDYLGKKYGGWTDAAVVYGRGSGNKWVCMPVGIVGNYINFRRSSIQKAGFKDVPEDMDGFLALLTALKKQGTPGGFALGHASGDGNAWTHWLLWAHGGKLVDENDKVAIDSAETRAALEYCKKLYGAFAPGTISWNDAFNNKAFLSEQIHLTGNGISIYAAAQRNAAKGDATAQKVADDMDHAYYPIGPVGKPTEFQAVFPVMGMSYTRYPNAVKAFLTYWMEADQYNAWIAESVGYITHTLKAYDDNKVWNEDPKRRVFRDAGTRTLPFGYPGTIGERAASAMADFIVVDMFANHASGRVSADDAIKQAARQAGRIYR